MLKVEIEPNVFFEIPDNLHKIYTNFEPYTRKFIAEHLKPGEVFVDIGANFGFFSLLAAGLVGGPDLAVAAIMAALALSDGELFLQKASNVSPGFTRAGNLL